MFLFLAFELLPLNYLVDFRSYSECFDMLNGRFYVDENTLTCLNLNLKQSITLPHSLDANSTTRM